MTQRRVPEKELSDVSRQPKRGPDGQFVVRTTTPYQPNNTSFYASFNQGPYYPYGQTWTGDAASKLVTDPYGKSAVALFLSSNYWVDMIGIGARDGIRPDELYLTDGGGNVATTLDLYGGVGGDGYVHQLYFDIRNYGVFASFRFYGMDVGDDVVIAPIVPRTRVNTAGEVIYPPSLAGRSAAPRPWE